MKTSRVLLVALLLALAGPAAADPQSIAFHGTGGNTFDNVFPAGPGYCDFDLEEIIDQTFSFEANFNLTNFTFEANNQIVLTITHVNDDTGYYLTEADRVTDRYELISGTTEVDRGVFWHLRTPDGRVVLVGAGKVTYDFATDPVTVTATPNTQLDADICAALGGAQF